MPTETNPETIPAPARNVYCAYARRGGKEAGFVGMYRTRDEAQTADPKANILVKRERITATDYAAWASSGFRSRGFVLPVVIGEGEPAFARVRPPLADLVDAAAGKSEAALELANAAGLPVRTIAVTGLNPSPLPESCK